MSKEITTFNQFRAYLNSKKINLDAYKYKEENNIYGLNGIKPLSNPYLWLNLISDHHFPAVDYLLYHDHTLFSSNIAIALLQSRKDIGLDNKRITKILDRLYEDQENKDFNTDGVLMDLITNGKATVLSKVVEYLKSHEIHPNPQGSFYRDGVAEAAKQENINIIRYIINQYPDIVEKSDVTWGYLNALKRANYVLAHYLIRQFDSLDIHAKNDLGYKLIERNHKNKKDPIDEANIQAYHFILDLYEIEHKNESELHS